MAKSVDEPHSSGGLDSDHELEATADSSGHAITIPDTHLLLSGDFKRAGNDLVISDGKEKFTVHDYFLSDKHPTLVSPQGATLTPDVVLDLAGSQAPGQYAQATAPQPYAQAIGRVVSESGNAVAIRNGVSVTLQVGDALLKGDVLQTGTDGKLAIIFNDGTTFELGADARIVLSEFVYDPKGSQNKEIISLLHGPFSFLAGKVAHTGDMEVKTPVATMGIRGTGVTGNLEQALTVTVLDEHDGVIHSVAIINPATGAVIGHATFDASAGQNGTWTVTASTAFEGTRDVSAAQNLAIFSQLLTNQTFGQQLLNSLSTQATGATGSSASANLYFIQTADNQIKAIIQSTSGANGESGTGGNTTAGESHQDQVYQQQYIAPAPPSTPPPFFIDTPTITRVEVASQSAFAPIESADGKFVAFLGGNLLPGNKIGVQSVYVYDRSSNTVTSATADIVGTHLHDGETFNDSVPSITGDGHYVVFAGKYQQTVQLVDPNDANNTFPLTNGAHETFIYNTRTGQTTLLSGNADAPVISADGHYVAVASTVYVWSGSQPVQESVINVIDRTTGLTVDQIAISADQSMSAEAGVHDASLSADGKYITFWTTAAKLDVDFGTQHEHFVLNGANGEAQVYRIGSARS